MSAAGEPRPALDVAISFGAGTEPVSGSLRGPDDIPREFTGWLELNSLLLELVEARNGAAGAGGGGPWAADG